MGLGRGVGMGGVVFFFLGWGMTVSGSSLDSHAWGVKRRATGSGLPLGGEEAILPWFGVQGLLGPTLLVLKRAHFQRIFKFSMGQNTSPRAQNGLKTLVRASQMVQDHFCKNVFLTHFQPTFGPKAAHFQGILGFSRAKTHHHGLKMG